MVMVTSSALRPRDVADEVRRDAEAEQQRHAGMSEIMESEVRAEPLADGVEAPVQVHVDHSLMLSAPCARCAPIPAGHDVDSQRTAAQTMLSAQAGYFAGQL